MGTTSAGAEDPNGSECTAQLYTRWECYEKLHLWIIFALYSPILLAWPAKVITGFICHFKIGMGGIVSSSKQTCKQPCPGSWSSSHPARSSNWWSVAEASRIRKVA